MELISLRKLTTEARCGLRQLKSAFFFFFF